MVEEFGQDCGGTSLRLHYGHATWSDKELDDYPGLPCEESFRTETMPCCWDTIGNATCAEIRRRRPVAFQRKCASDAEFGMIQCCGTCGNDVRDMWERRPFFAAGTRSRHCFDRHGRDFCLRFLHRLEPWTRGESTCSGSSAPLAFRVCQKTCGFCDKKLKSRSREPTDCPETEDQPLWNQYLEGTRFKTK
ncbi:hypothetical protein QR680_011731 [Steinernema hermaphroditum]|uniref:Uncharacterized protein n=1 Tax=Steinernema hermaphroditum TaxID=289476 RepID=A0AA39HZI3_9BILA|nr:hypothetical protein QR680_011731 [Steinernema hermaphroditum]